MFDNGGPNDVHLEPTIAAAQAGKHIICEKPLGRTAEESFEIWKGVAATGVKHQCAFNYRFFPAIRLAKQMIDAGEIGEIYHFRGRYHQEWVMDPQFPKVWRLDKAVAGSGALGDLGAHVIDQSRYLIGEPSSVTGLLRTFITERPGGTVDVDDAFQATVEFENGANGTYEATRFAPGRKNQMRWEINGSKGTIVFDQERMNELQVYLGGTKPGEHAQGFRNVLVSEAYHPYWEHHWPHGHMIGWEDSFVHELLHLLTAIREDTPIGPHGATFEDGYRCAEICDAIVRSHETGQRQRDRVPVAVSEAPLRPDGQAGGRHRRLPGHRPVRGHRPGARRGATSRSTTRARRTRPSETAAGIRAAGREVDRAPAATPATRPTSTSWPTRRSTRGAASTSGSTTRRGCW